MADNAVKTVAYQGVEGAYSEAVSSLAFPAASRQSCETFEELFQAVSSGSVERGIIPIENTHSGTFIQNYDLLLKYKVVIVGEFTYSEPHCLVASEGTTIDDVKRLATHPHVLEQCSQFVASLATVDEVLQLQDTAAAAQRIAEKGLKDTAAIASPEAAAKYGLKVLKDKIMDDPNACTRFLIISSKPADSTPSGSIKTSIAVALPNEPMAMFKCLSCFALRNINVSKFETRPSARCGSMSVTSRPWEYLIYLDFEASMDEDVAENAVRSLNEFTTHPVRVFGSYPRYQPKGIPSQPYGL
eukprot:TRINITY_DN1648_c0_g1_i3.p1 TRINITY_DN1648_c0_g1~~TRINITY_DN1648_c0_g1_i3.p1  ORF type:complete len:300 (+),score=72.54 TRINITY_DN1648_c0_g1_i3:48-947(+)